MIPGGRTVSASRCCAGSIRSAILRNIALFHPESIDDTGYPEGRTGDDIPIEARVAAVADVFDALRSSRDEVEEIRQRFQENTIGERRRKKAARG